MIPKKFNLPIALLFLALSLLFLFAMTDVHFFDWAFNRHQNQWSWYIRPLFLIPFCYFSYKRSWAGISFTIFCILTSMFWFKQPELINQEVITFLQFEKDWLLSGWNNSKIIALLAVPISFLALGYACWKRSIYLCLAVLVSIALAKLFWSIQYGGESGKSIIMPAIIGLIICMVLIYFGFKKSISNQSN